MSGTGFLTRLIAQNLNGPHVALWSEALADEMAAGVRQSVDKSYVCTVCNDGHSSHERAKNCCSHDPEEIVVVLDNALMVHIEYECRNCEAVHASCGEATACCPKATYIYTEYVCPTCEESHEDKDDASTCCIPDGQMAVLGKKPQCMVCLVSVKSCWVMGDAHEKLSWWVEAAKCCLPVQHPTLTTADCMRVGQLLAGGTGWLDAIAQVESEATARAALAFH